MRVGHDRYCVTRLYKNCKSLKDLEKKSNFKTCLRNSLLPIITVFASIFPMVIGGSIIIEEFSHSEMGVEIYTSILIYIIWISYNARIFD